ncbi:hypothetical protein TNCV_4005251 [Trichonephila clavipes]|nr:hypothetical protein TNCV_4005251 [Trichonephila clavipes]
MLTLPFVQIKCILFIGLKEKAIQSSANLPSRGCSVNTFKEERWWEGASWLRNQTEDRQKSELFPDKEVINLESGNYKKIAAAWQMEEKYYLRYSS